MLTLTPPPKSMKQTHERWHPAPASILAKLTAYQLGDPPIAEIVRHHSQEQAAEGYRLVVREQGPEIHCSSDRGYFYGIQTLKQVIQQSQSSEGIPGCDIIDWPDFPSRGILLDISRDRVPTQAMLYHLVDLWGSLKYNELQLYMEAAFDYEGHAAAVAHRSPLTATEIRELDQYCAKKGISLIANQNTFGHMERWLDLPDYQHLAEQVGGCIDPHGNHRNHSFCLNPVSELSVAFVDDLLSQLLPCFSDNRININADETFDLGQGASNAKCRELGKDRVYLNYVKHIHELCTRKGKRVQMWSDILLKYPHLLPELPKDITVMNWGYEADHPFDRECAQLKSSGIDFQVVAATGTFAAFSGRWLNAYQNALNAAQNGLKYGASGFYMSEWGDFGHGQAWISAYPGYFIGAVAGWHVAALSDFNTERAVQHQVLNNATLAIALLKLGNLYLSTLTADQLPFVSVIGVLLFNQMTNRHMKKLSEWYPRGFRHGWHQCQQLIEALGAITPEDERQSYWQRELLLTARLSAHACALGEALSEQRDYRVERLSFKLRQQLAEELEPLISDYADLWLEHSRPGGLEDSQARLDYLLSLYRSPPRAG
ncbi:MAG: beta-N-acetylhexosaminidase [Saccharospirillum sp.]|nr:beta-N-acetylhexosaminidase [Saccharospirillum sp.]